MNDVFIALGAVCILTFLFDITSRGRNDTISKVMHFFEVPIAALIVAASYYFHRGGV